MVEPGMFRLPSIGCAAKPALDESNPKAPAAVEEQTHWFVTNWDLSLRSDVARNRSHGTAGRIGNPYLAIRRPGHRPNHPNSFPGSSETLAVRRKRKDCVPTSRVVTKIEVQTIGSRPQRSVSINEQCLGTWCRIPEFCSNSAPLTVREFAEPVLTASPYMTVCVFHN